MESTPSSEKPVTSTTSSTSPVHQGKAGNKGMIIVVVVILLICCCCGIAGAVAYYTSMNTNTNNLPGAINNYNQKLDALQDAADNLNNRK